MYHVIMITRHEIGIVNIFRKNVGIGEVINNNLTGLIALRGKFRSTSKYTSKYHNDPPRTKNNTIALWNYDAKHMTDYWFQITTM